jgi:hypothetical protein
MKEALRDRNKVVAGSAIYCHWLPFNQARPRNRGDMVAKARHFPFPKLCNRAT